MDVYVRQGDSLWLYSQLFNVPLQLIVDSNRTIQQNQLYIGQNIQIPGFIATYYEIKAGFFKSCCFSHSRRSYLLGL
jgi:g-D-glutamyl-meso-diaminopimelate peptidase